MSILLDNVSKRFGEQWAVNRVSFEIKSGEIAGFIGPNGAGKSTTMKIITGYLPATSGKVMVNGLDIRRELMKIRRSIGYLPEHNPLYYDMYVKEYLIYVAGLYGIRGNEAAARVEEIIGLVGLTMERKKKIGMLSKGYRQRVGISQALIHDPDVLILDEPTSGLDPNQIVEIRNLISAVGKEKTVLLSTHIMQEVEAICDRVIVIDHGEIRADGAATSIGRNGPQTIQVELETAADPGLWENMKEVREVRILPGNIYLLAADPETDIRSRIFRYAVSRNLTILTMTVQEKSLEEVFRELTT